MFLILGVVAVGMIGVVTLPASKDSIVNADRHQYPPARTCFIGGDPYTTYSVPAVGAGLPKHFLSAVERGKLVASHGGALRTREVLSQSFCQCAFAGL